MDFGKAVGFHRMYGHVQFLRECLRHGKTVRFKDEVCLYLKCKDNTRRGTV